tara:strand:- start:586 stop:996 length:411 start_codon:yes stop_codon:yes gene_type:complete
MASALDLLKDAIIDAMKGSIPAIVSEGFTKLADKEEDPLGKAMLGVMAEWVEKYGPDGIDLLAENICALIDDTDPAAIHRLQGDGLYLSDLVDALQSAEAERREKQSKVARQIGVGFRKLGEVLATAAAEAIKLPA